MDLLIYSVYDSKAEAFLPPFFLPREEMAIRTFSDAVNSNDHQFGRHPEDYNLFRLGTFDDSSGELRSEITPIVVAYALELRSKDRDKATEGQYNGGNTEKPTEVGNDAPVLAGATSEDSP